MPLAAKFPSCRISCDTGTKTSTISIFEHSLVLSKNRTISSTNWENQHYFETLSALTLKTWTSFKTSALSLSFETVTVSVLEVPRLVRSQHWWWLQVTVTFRCRARQVRKKSKHASVDLLHDGHIMQHFWRCNLSKCCGSTHFLSQCNESEHKALPNIIIWHSVR